MSRTHAQIIVLVLQMLQDTGASTYGSAETGYAVAESLKEFAVYDPHISSMVFKIESRTGTDTAGTSKTLTDTTKSQFTTTDDSDEKVIHNTIDNTWATATAATASTETVITLTSSIMASGENYEIYNKRCWNKKQIYIGDVTDYLWVDSVEYPVGTKRNFKVYGDVLEIDADSIADSDLTVATLPDIDVLVRFAKPHVLTSLVVLGGKVKTTTTVGATSIGVYTFTDNEVVGLGDEFYLAGQRTVYSVTLGATMTNQTSSGRTIYFYPALVAEATADIAITFVKSTLKAQHEELFCHLVAARAVLSDNIRHIDAIPKGGPDVWARYQQWGERKLAEVLGKMERLRVPKTKHTYPRDQDEYL